MDSKSALIAARDERALRLPEVLELVGVGESTLYDWMADGHFPRPRKFGRSAKLAVWLLSDVVAYMRAQPVYEGEPRAQRTPAAARRSRRAAA